MPYRRISRERGAPRSARTCAHFNGSLCFPLAAQGSESTPANSLRLRHGPVGDASRRGFRKQGTRVPAAASTTMRASCSSDSCPCSRADVCSGIHGAQRPGQSVLGRKTQQVGLDLVIAHTDAERGAASMPAQTLSLGDDRRKIRHSVNGRNHSIEPLSANDFGVRPKGTARHGPRHLGQRDARRWPIVQAYPLATRVSSADKSASCATTNTEPRSCVDPACPAPRNES